METHPNAKRGTQRDVFAIITGKIIEQLEKGTVPWRKPWTDAGAPRNLISKKAYRGVNVMLLSSLGYERNLFITSKQLKEIGGSIKPDEKPHMVVFWNYVEKELDGAATEPESSKKKTPFLRYYSVYNIAQCAGISDAISSTAPREANSILECDQIVAAMPQCPPIKHKESKAYYDPLQDFINMPKKAAFESTESYYSTLFHELVHSTGHHSRLSRIGLIQMSEFGSEAYSLEELVAEIGACYLQSFTGITSQFEQSAAYIQGWLQKLKNDTHFIFTASSLAQKATDFILNVKTDFEDKPQAEE